MPITPTSSTPNIPPPGAAAPTPPKALAALPPIQDSAAAMVQLQQMLLKLMSVMGTSTGAMYQITMNLELALTNAVTVLNALEQPGGATVQNVTTLTKALTVISQLNQGLDPTTGKPLPAAVEAILSAPMAGVAGALLTALQQMAAYTNPSNSGPAADVAAAGAALVQWLQGDPNPPTPTAIQGSLNAAGNEAFESLAAVNSIIGNQYSESGFSSSFLSEQVSQYEQQITSLEGVIGGIATALCQAATKAIDNAVQQ